MKLALTPEQSAELEPVFRLLDGEKVCCGQIKRTPYSDDGAGQFALFFTLISQQTARRIRAAIEKEQNPKAR
jgi:hypothetical protein